MSDPKGQDRNARIGLARPSTGASRIELSRPAGGRLELKKGVENGMVRQSFSHGRSKPVAVEVKRTRPVAPPPVHAPAARPHVPTEARQAPPAAAVQSHPATQPTSAATPAPATPAQQAPAQQAPMQPTPAAPAQAAPAAVAPPAQATEAEAPPPAEARASAEARAEAAPIPAPAVEARAAPVTPPATAPAVDEARPAAAPVQPRPAAPVQPRRAAAPVQPRAASAPTPRAGIPHRVPEAPPRPQQGRPRMLLKPLTDDEKAVRLRALSEARKGEEEARKRAEENARRAAEDAARRKAEEEAATKRKAEEEARKKHDEETKRRAEELAAKALAEEDRRQKEDEARKGVGGARKAGVVATPEAPPEEGVRRPAGAPRPSIRALADEGDDERKGKARGAGGKAEKRPVLKRPEKDAKRPAKIVLDREAGDLLERRTPSLAAMRRHRERERRQMQATPEVVTRDVVLPESITVQELAARMAVRGAEVIKALMKSGIMATINQTLDADTAELVVGEFGHKVRRVTEADVEIGIEGDVDEADDLQPRSPVVTVMGHVDHGKTSLLDALRATDVAAGEAGGITQHIGAYQVDIGSGRPVTFIDTPGHAAFTAMRARGAAVTDVVVLVVAADDGVMPQTVEAIRHAKAAKVPMIVAINKIDKPEANPERVKNELLSHEVVLEDFGGDVLSVEVSATKRTGLEKLIELIQLQAELLDLKSNPNRPAQGTIIEAKLDRGRGVAATVLIQRGTLRVGDLVVCGAQWGRARALLNDRMEPVTEAGPSMPVEILGLDGVPDAGDVMVVLESERQAREIAEYRQRKKREQQQVVSAGSRNSLEEMFSALRSGESKELPIVIKSDVHGSLEAIIAGLDKLKTNEVGVRVLHGGVGAITESDVTLAQASKGMILGFNVRANALARDMAKREGIELRYYSIIYELLDEMKAMLSGMLAPEAREVILGHAEIREVFSITKVGKIAGCRVIDGVIRKTGRSRLLRDNVVVFDGTLGSLKRFKDDVREVREGFECGIALENYNDIRQGDVIEVYEVQEFARTL
jgi:translation initiation factor IF-2